MCVISHAFAWMPRRLIWMIMCGATSLCVCLPSKYMHARHWTDQRSIFIHVKISWWCFSECKSSVSCAKDTFVGLCVLVHMFIYSSNFRSKHRIFCGLNTILCSATSKFMENWFQLSIAGNGGRRASIFLHMYIEICWHSVFRPTDRPTYTVFTIVCVGLMRCDRCQCEKGETC